MRVTPFLVGSLLAVAARGQTLQQLRDEVREAAQKGRYTALLAGLLDLADTRAISASHLRIDATPSLDVSLLKLPYARDFPLAQGGPELRVEAGLGAFEAHAEMADLWQGGAPGLETGLRSRWRGVSGTLGAGPRFDLGGGVHFAPLLVTSLAYLENDALYSGPGAPTTAALLDGILFQWHATEAAYGGTARLEHDVDLGRELTLHSRARFDARRFESLGSTDAAQREATTVERLTLISELAGPTGWTIGDGSLDWSTRVAWSRFLGPEADAVGFVDCVEIGGGLSCPLPSDRVWCSRLILAGGVLFGEDVFGWNLGFAVAF